MAVNLELHHAMMLHDVVTVPVTAKENKNKTQEDAVDYWMRNMKGKGWIILDIDVHTHAWLFWEESITQYKKRSLGFVKPNARPLELQNPDILIILEVDKFTPPFLFDIAKSAMAPGARLVILERQGW